MSFSGGYSVQDLLRMWSMPRELLLLTKQRISRPIAWPARVARSCRR